MVDARVFEIVRSQALSTVPHGFFGHGAELKASPDQFGYGGPGDADEVRAIRGKAADALVSGAKLAAPHQVHSADVITVTQGWDDSPEGRPFGDAVVTSQPGIALGIVTADCGPVLFADSQAGVVGAAHAGWRGAQGGVLENTIAAMEALGADRANIAAVIGPTIAQASYEVDAAFRAHFAEEDEPSFAEAPRRDGSDRWHFNLPGYIAARLHKAGIASVENIARDTFSEPMHFYSYRRAMQSGEPEYGRQISLIALG